MAKVVFLTPADARYGFSLAGALQLTVKVSEAEAQLRKTLADSDVGVVVIDERLAKRIPEADFVALEHSFPGLLVTLPAPATDPDAAEDYLQRLIRRALGYHVRLEL